MALILPSAVLTPDPPGHCHDVGGVVVLDCDHHLDIRHLLPVQGPHQAHLDIVDIVDNVDNVDIVDVYIDIYSLTLPVSLSALK